MANYKTDHSEVYEPFLQSKNRLKGASDYGFNLQTKT